MDLLYARTGVEVSLDHSPNLADLYSSCFVKSVFPMFYNSSNGVIRIRDQSSTWSHLAFSDLVQYPLSYRE